MVSIILPNLNTPIKFLKKRLASIKSQLYTNWECIVIDGFSNNYSWEYIINETTDDLRFKLFQMPQKGIYNAWNEGISLSRGEYIYIATSDDTFEINFLQVMVNSLERNKDCKIAHCCLNLIDHEGKLTTNQWINWEKVNFYGDKINQYHKRIAPYDAIMHFGWSTVYTSIVQLLIKKEVFERDGLFNTDFGPIADFEWGLRVSMKYNVLHVPKFLASWRRHDQQATKDDLLKSPKFFSLLLKMSVHVISKMKSNKDFKTSNWESLLYVYLYNQINITTSRRDKLKFVLTGLFNYPKVTLNIITDKLKGINSPQTSTFLLKELQKRGLSDNIEIIPSVIEA